MTMADLIFSPHAHYNASSLVLVVADLIAAFIMSSWLFRFMKNDGASFTKLFHVRPMRMVIGAIVGFIGVAAGSIMWLPAFPLLISGNEELSTWYILVATWPANIANMLSVVGLSIILWPWMVTKFKGWTIPFVLLMTTAVYIFGVIGSIYAGELISQWSRNGF